MTADMLDIARRVVACKGWRWMAGMLVADAIGKQRIYDDVAGEPYWSTDGWLPDFDDPATMGCLLALVREAWGAPRTVVEAAKYGWGIVVGGHWIFADTEAEALVAALEAAP